MADSSEVNLEGRIHREFEYTNSDGGEGVIQVSFGQWNSCSDEDSPIMISFDDACWMEVETAEEFQRWFKVAVSEAKRRHKPE